MHQPLHLTRTSGTFDHMTGVLGRVGLKIQDTIANILGFKNANNLGKATTRVGVGVLALSPFFGPFAPLAYTAGVWVAGAGIGDLAGNAVLKRMANADGKGRA